MDLDTLKLFSAEPVYKLSLRIQNLASLKDGQMLADIGLNFAVHVQSTVLPYCIFLL